MLRCQVSTFNHYRVLSPAVSSMGPVGDNTEKRLKPGVDKGGPGLG